MKTVKTKDTRPFCAGGCGHQCLTLYCDACAPPIPRNSSDRERSRTVAKGQRGGGYKLRVIGDDRRYNGSNMGS